MHRALGEHQLPGYRVRCGESSNSGVTKCTAALSVEMALVGCRRLSPTYEVLPY